MKDDEFEKSLQALASPLNRPDPTAAWKTDILARARQEAVITPIKRNLPPRWLMLGWAAAWVLILALNFSNPDSNTSAAYSGSSAREGQQTAPNPTPPQTDQTTLFAFHRQPEFYLDLP